MQVQFNLDLSVKEREDRSKVILPFEHQGLPSWTYSRTIRIPRVIHVLEIRNSYVSMLSYEHNLSSYS